MVIEAKPIARRTAGRMEHVNSIRSPYTDRFSDPNATLDANGILEARSGR